MKVLPARSPRPSGRDPYRRPLVQVPLDDDPGGDQRGDDRNDPDDRDPRVFFPYLDRSGTSGKSASSVICLLLSLAGIPDQAGVERFRAKIVRMTTAREEQDSGFGRNGHERF